jgi:hypothetical protein
MRAQLRIGAVACVLAVLSACGRDTAPAAPSTNAADGNRPTLRETPPPSMAGVDMSLQERIRASYASLTSQRSHTNDRDRGRVYGQVGKLLLAAELYDQAEPYLLNAAALDPSELAWPYFLAHAYRLTFKSDKAIARFEDVLRLKPDHVPALVWLGTMHVDNGRADLAEPTRGGACCRPGR